MERTNEFTGTERALVVEQTYGFDITDRKANVRQDLGIATAAAAAVGSTEDLTDGTEDAAPTAEEAREQREAPDERFALALGERGTPNDRGEPTISVTRALLVVATLCEARVADWRLAEKSRSAL